MTLTVTGFPDGGQIPVKFSQAAERCGAGRGYVAGHQLVEHARRHACPSCCTCTTWTSPGNKTTDDQAHWVVWNIPATATGLPEGVPEGVAAARRQLSDQRDRSRCTAAPAPPANGPLASLHVRDLRARHEARRQTDGGRLRDARANVMKAMQGHVLGKAVYGGLFKRPQ